MLSRGSRFQWFPHLKCGMNYQTVKSTLLAALDESGKLLRRSIEDRNVVAKKTELSLVTATDHASEEAILGIIRQTFPDHAFLTEESPPMGHSSCRWIIDPIDGTTNYAHTLPVACVSIAFEDHGELIQGGVYDPFRNELFFAERGKGATLNDRPIAVSSTPILREAIVATGFPYDRRVKADDYLAIFKQFMMKSQGVRRMGAAALDLSYVACGRLDGFWEAQLEPWDKAAGMLIIAEAGGQLSDYSGGPLTLTGKENVISNGQIHNEMISVLDRFKGVS